MNKDVDREKASEDLELDELRRLEDLEKQESERAKLHRRHIDLSKGIVFDEFRNNGQLDRSTLVSSI